MPFRHETGLSFHLEISEPSTNALTHSRMVLSGIVSHLRSLVMNEMKEISE